MALYEYHSIERPTANSSRRPSSATAGAAATTAAESSTGLNASTDLASTDRGTMRSALASPAGSGERQKPAGGLSVTYSDQQQLRSRLHSEAGKPTSATVSVSRPTGWRLPFREALEEACVRKSRAAVQDEFRRLDIMSEGRLTYLNLRSALELREVREPDATVRRWMQEHDRGHKGYVSLADYEAIYANCIIGNNSSAASGRGSGLGRGAEAMGDTMDSLGTAESRSDHGSTGLYRGSHYDSIDRGDAERAQQQRQDLLRKAFDRYDTDRDGRISTEDLQQAFTAQGRAFTPQDLEAWVSSRDSSGTGAVSFEDFVKHYK